MDDNIDIEFYKRVRRFIKFCMDNIYDIEVNGLENIPSSGPYLLAGNHLNILDSCLLLAIIDENLRFMVDKKLYRYKLWEKFFRSVGTFPIDPENLDITAVKTAISLLKAGEVEVIFPEGKTHKINASVPFKGGIPRIANLARVEVIPFGINATYVPFSKLNINIGEAINFRNINVAKEEHDNYLESVVRKLENH